MVFLLDACLVVDAVVILDQKLSAAQFPLYLHPSYKLGSQIYSSSIIWSSRLNILTAIDCIVLKMFWFFCSWIIVSRVVPALQWSFRVAVSDGVCFTLDLLIAEIPQPKLKPISHWLKCPYCLVHHIVKCSCYFYLLFLSSPLYSHDFFAVDNVDFIFES